MKDYRFFANVLLMVFCSCLTGCNKKASTSDKVKTGKAIEITAESVVLAGKVNVDIKDYNSVEFGMMISDNLQDMNNRKGDKGWSRTLIGNNYTIELDGLMESTKYYYCAFVFLNETQYEFGAIKDFTTQEIIVEKNKDKAFSVSATKQVRFAPGNLQYTRSTNTWSFAEHQYDMLETDNVIGGKKSYDGIYGYSKSGSGLSDKIDLFCWSGSTGSAMWGIGISQFSSAYSGNFIDWGTNIGDGKTWYALTYDEWSYLQNSRTNSNQYIGVARININADGTEYVNGLVLLPDSWTCPADVTFKSGFPNMFGVQSYADYQTFTLSNWQKLESTGAVFLPASGERGGACVGYVQSSGNYWSSTPAGNSFAYYLHFCSKWANSNNNYSGRGGGYAVRLVQNVQ